MPNCRYCGATIKWVETNKGKLMPVDPELISSDDCEHGDFLVTEDGRVLKVDHSRNDYESTDGYVSHFATCPDANTARKPRGN
jgi:hypothetical protein